MAKVILQPAGKGAAQTHYRNTIQNPVPINRLRPFLSETETQQVSKRYTDGMIPVWALLQVLMATTKNGGIA
jgi:hypothetical protein